MWALCAPLLAIRSMDAVVATICLFPPRGHRNGPQAHNYRADATADPLSVSGDRQPQTKTTTILEGRSKQLTALTASVKQLKRFAASDANEERKHGWGGQCALLTMQTRTAQSYEAHLIPGPNLRSSP